MGVTARIVGLFALLTIASESGLAQEDSGAQEDVNNASVSEDKKKTTWVNKGFSWIVGRQEDLSSLVYSSATAIDRYVAKEVYDESELNTSYLSASSRLRFEEAGDQAYETKLKGKLDIPNTKRSLKLIFDTEPEDFDSLEDVDRESNLSGEDPLNSDNDPIAGVRIESEKRRIWKPHLDLGVRINRPLDPYTRIGVRRSDEISKNLTSRFRQTLFYFATDGWGSQTSFDLLRPVYDDMLVKSRTSGKYLGNERSWEYLQSFSLYQRVSNYNALEYQVGTVAENESQSATEISKYWLRFEWHNRLYKDWLYFKLSPEVLFPREDNFNATYSLTLQVEIFFSKDPNLSNIRIKQK